MKNSSAELEAHLDNIDPYEFEQQIADVWEEQGWKTTVTSGSQDRGIDIVARQKNPVEQKVLIQAKAYNEKNKIGSEEVRRYATLYQQENDVDGVVIVTTSWFTTQAEELASDLGVKLVDRAKFVEIASETDLSNREFKSNIGESLEDDWLNESITPDRSDVFELFGAIQILEGFSRDMSFVDVLNEIGFVIISDTLRGPAQPRDFSFCPRCVESHIHDPDENIWGMEFQEESGKTAGLVVCGDCLTHFKNPSLTKTDWELLSLGLRTTEDIDHKGELQHWMNIVPGEGIYRPNPFKHDIYNLVEKQPTKSNELCPACHEQDGIWRGISDNCGKIMMCENCGTRWEEMWGLSRLFTRWKCVEDPNDLTEVGATVTR